MKPIHSRCRGQSSEHEVNVSEVVGVDLAGVAVVGFCVEVFHVDVLAVGLLHGLGAEEEEDEQDEIKGGLADEVEGGSVGGRAAGTGRRRGAQDRDGGGG